MCGSDARLCRANPRASITGASCPYLTASADGDGAGLVVDFDLIEMLERDLVLRAVGDAIE